MHTAAMRKSAPRKTVLVVDDSNLIRTQLGHLFLSDSFTTCNEAANGQEAITEAEKCQPDLIVLDLSMPVMNGLEAAPELRRLLPNTPIILYTLHASDIPVTALQGSGINSVIAKNDPIETLLQTANRLLRH
jgi:CheY-like chemotaxis protein